MEDIPDNPIIVPNTQDTSDSGSGPFEGPEKLLEIWFAPEPPSVADGGVRTGLRTVDRLVWEEMLDIVKCKVLSTIEGRDMDAYLLSESSFFVFPHKLILKTCGTTLNLLGLPRILAIAKEHCSLDKVWRCFYSRKSFMFPERQMGPHREWRNEVEYLDALFDNGAAYTVGKMNGDHWLLYLTSPPDDEEAIEDAPTEVPDDSADQGNFFDDGNDDGPLPESLTASTTSTAALSVPFSLSNQDYTIEILMTKLAAPARRPFFFLEEDIPSTAEPAPESSNPHVLSAHKGAAVSEQLGISSLFPPSLTTLDSYAFEPCGYSANALISMPNNNGSEGYYTIHVTPEEGWSYASFECNVPLKPRASGDVIGDDKDVKDVSEKFPDLETLIQRVVNIFQPGHISLTLFVSSGTDSVGFDGNIEGKEGEPDVEVETAQKVFRQALLPRGYKRTDKINYEFGGYDLAFATFQKK